MAREARALLTRLAKLKPFALFETTIPAAAISFAAQAAIETHMAQIQKRLRRRVLDFLRWLLRFAVGSTTTAMAQRRFTFLRMRFNALLSQFDIFADVLTQRSEYEIGIWLAGLDVAAKEALSLPGNFYRLPPVVCYLDRGVGAAIRRVRTRLPGGSQNPVAIIRIPRERMVGSAIASSLVHEVGHQASALLGLIDSMRTVLKGLQKSGGQRQIVWRLLEAWISEILADFWSVAKVGVASTLGLMEVMSLPRFFVFRINFSDPHPTPWIRVKLSCGIGQALYPHPQWQKLSRSWENMYPLAAIDREKRQLLWKLESSIPAFAALLVNHRPRSLNGKSLQEVMPAMERQPPRLRARYQAWRWSLKNFLSVSPTLAFAVLGQAKIDGKISPEMESSLITALLEHWALRRAQHNTRNVREA